MIVHNIPDGVVRTPHPQPMDLNSFCYGSLLVFVVIVLKKNIHKVMRSGHPIDRIKSDISSARISPMFFWSVH